MRWSVVSKVGLVVFLAPVFTACEAHYVDRDGTSYYDANDRSTDMLPSGPYTKGGQYINNPDEATNTRDNRGSRPQGYGHDADEDYRGSSTTVVYPAGTVVYGDGTVVYPDGTTIAPGGTTVYSGPARSTTTTTTVTHTSP